MTNSLIEIKAEYQDTLNDCLRFCYFVRDRQYQDESIKRLERLKSNLTTSKAHFVALGDEDASNQLLSLEKISQAFINELKMLVALKDNDPHSAWDFLINAQTSAQSALRSHEIAQGFENQFKRFYVYEHLLFPPQTFMSAGIIIKRSTCSICGSEYGDCDHISGRPYMGELCTREITECDLQEVSIVPKPANKHALMLVISDGKTTRDLMTLREIQVEPGEEPGSIHNKIISSS